MRGPRPPSVELSRECRRELAVLVSRHGTPQQRAVRGRVILLAADGQNNSEIARRLGLDVDTVRHWRTRWLRLAGVSPQDLSVAQRLMDAPRPGAPPRITPEQVCKVIELACEAPEKSGRPISQWSGREIAEEVVGRGIIGRISPRHASRLLKRGG
jgi:putative transposase